MAGALAMHFLRGRLLPQAVPYLQQAGARAYDPPRSARRWPTSTRLSRPLRTCPSPATPGGWPSSSASLCRPC